MNDRFLANENVPVEIVSWLRTQGHDVIHALDTLAGAPDVDILRLAAQESRILLTHDRDFGELIFRGRLRGVRGIVLFRFARMSPGLMLEVVRSFFQANPHLVGRYTVVTPGQYRQTFLE